MLDRILKLALLPLTALHAHQSSLVTSDYLHIDVPCLFTKVFGLQCWGCGLSRALDAFWHGDFLLAEKFNMLVYPTVYMLAILFLLESFNVSITIIPKGVLRG